MSGEPPENTPPDEQRSRLPGALEHVGDRDEFEIEMARGAGLPVEGEAELPAAGEDRNGAEANGLVDDVHAAEVAEGETALSPVVPSPAAPGSAVPGPVAPGLRRPPATSPTSADERPRRRQGRTTAEVEEEHANIFQRAMDFLRASWSELQRVQWPDRRSVFQATAVVLGFVVVAGVYLGLADWVAGKLVSLVI